MNLFDNCYVELIATISEDFVMIPIKMVGPISETRKALESMDSLIDEPIERHNDKEFNRQLLTSSLSNLQGVNS